MAEARMRELPVIACRPSPKNPPVAFSAWRMFLTAAHSHFLPSTSPFYFPVVMTNFSIGLVYSVFRKDARPDWTTLRLPARLPWIDPAKKFTWIGLFEFDTAMI